MSGQKSEVGTKTVVLLASRFHVNGSLDIHSQANQ